MAEVAPDPVAAAVPAKALKKKQATKVKRGGPTLRERIVKAVSASKERNGVSLAALKKVLICEGYDVENNSHHVRAAVKSLVTNGTLVQVKGSGASGSFKLNKKQEAAKKPVKKAAPKAKKPAAKKAAPAKKSKKVVVKKSTPKKSPKKPAAAAKKTVKTISKSPKRAKKATAAKDTKSPKKVKAAKPKVTKPTKTAKTKKTPKKK